MARKDGSSMTSGKKIAGKRKKSIRFTPSCSIAFVKQSKFLSVLALFGGVRCYSILQKDDVHDRWISSYFHNH